MKTALLVFHMFFLLGCGSAVPPSEPATPPVVMPTPVPTPDPLPAPDPKKVIMAVWGTPWCSACKSVLPQVEKAFAKLDAATQAKIEFRLYVPTGVRATDRPTDEVALAYRSSLHLDHSVAYIDPWNFTLYKHYKLAGNSSPAIPAGAITKMDGTLIRRFPPGQLYATDIVQSAVEEAAK